MLSGGQLVDNGPSSRIQAPERHLVSLSAAGSIARSDLRVEYAPNGVSYVTQVTGRAVGLPFGHAAIEDETIADG